MATAKVNLDVSQYVKINNTAVQLLLQAHRDSVRIAISASKPALSNTAFHLLGGKDAPLTINVVDEDVWALAMTDKSSLIITELNPSQVIAGASDMATDAWGLQKVVQPHSLFHSLFTFGVPIKKWNSIVNGTEEDISTSTLVTASNGLLSVKSAANNGDITYLHSRRHPQYQSNRGHLWSGSIIVPVPTDNAYEDFGLFTDINGVFFRIKTDGKLYACETDGTLTNEEEITMPFTLDYTKGNVFDIQYQWRGAGNFKFFAGNPNTGRIQLIHTIENLNLLTSLTIANPSLPAAFRITSFGAAGEVKCGCVDVTSEGGDDKHEQYVSAKSLEKATNGTNIPILIIHSPDQVGGKMNTTDGRLARVSGASDKRSVFQIWATRDPAAFTGATFNPVGDGSNVEFDVAATAVNTALLSFVTAFRVEANSFVPLSNPSKDNIDFFFIHGDYIVVTATAVSGTCDAVIEWGEEV